MYQPSVSTPSKRIKEKLNPRSVGTDVDHYEVITDVVPISIVLGHANPIRKPKTTASKKGKPSKVSVSSSLYMTAIDVRNFEPSTDVKKCHSTTSLYLDPINVEPNVDASEKSCVVPKVMGNVETSEKTIKPRSVTTLSKSSMIVAERDNFNTNFFHVLISQVLGIEPKTGVVPNVSTSLAQTDNPIETPLDKSDGNVSTKSPKKSEEKDDSDGMYGDLSDKEENFSQKKDQSTYIVNVDDLDFDDEPISKRLDPGIDKKKNWLEILVKALSEEGDERNLKGDNAGEEDANEKGVDTSDDE
ncbi:hypothetical protein KIW84_040822 [Lathyrus oleraceus]|uniref:Uncharacterized protein n=1 Tax=Pisum sativum TaxID=3888 RepID=A0A9D4X8B4_PEA|nr:hypothetical protein KIW84_040822 [Pisum sativum]